MYMNAETLMPTGLPTANDDMERIERLQAHSEHVDAAIGQIVDALLEMKQKTEAPSAQLAAIQSKLNEIEQTLSNERACRDFAQVSRMHPKERVTVFVGTLYFGDNVKYAWLGMQESAEARGIECWFLPYHAEQQAQVEALGGRCFPADYRQWTPEHLHTALSAGVLITSDHFLNPNPYAAALLAGARHIQLWHGVSIKEIGLRNLPSGRSLGPHLARVLATTGRYSRMAGTTAKGETEWRRWFSFEEYLPIGYPRNDVLYREPTEGDLANVDRDVFDQAGAALSKGNRVFIYAPTFRDADRGRWLLSAGLARIAEAVARTGDLLIVNMHPVEQAFIPQLKASMPSVSFVRPGTDAYPLLSRTSALITDYSSVMFDYLHLNRPILLYRPDHAAYVARSRRLFDEKLSVLPGPLLESPESLINALKDTNLAQAGRHRRARQELLAEWFDNHDGNACGRLMKAVEEELTKAIS